MHQAYIHKTDHFPLTVSLVYSLDRYHSYKLLKKNKWRF